MNSRDFSVLFSHEWKSKYISAIAFPNINTAFGNIFVNERTVLCWYAKFDAGDERINLFEG